MIKGKSKSVLVGKEPKSLVEDADGIWKES